MNGIKVNAPSPSRNCTNSAAAQKAGYSHPPSLFVKSQPFFPCTVTIVPRDEWKEKQCNPARNDPKEQTPGAAQLDADSRRRNPTRKPQRFEKFSFYGNRKHAPLEKRVRNEHCRETYTE